MATIPRKREHADHMTVGQLRAALAQVPAEYDDAPLYTEGCDCFGPCGALERADSGDYPSFTNEGVCFLLTRDDRCFIEDFEDVAKAP